MVTLLATGIIKTLVYFSIKRPHPLKPSVKMVDPSASYISDCTINFQFNFIYLYV